MQSRKKILTHKDGFSLVELSIGLIIIAFFTSAVLVGESLLGSANDRKVISEMQKHITNINSFKAKYDALPGDMRYATKIWGSMSSCTTPNPTRTGTQTCDGNGNSEIEDMNGSVSQPRLPAENFLLWQHLANAGLMYGEYTGLSEHYSQHVVPATNAPESKVNEDAAWDVDFSIRPHTFSFMPKETHFLILGGESTLYSHAGENIDPVFSVERVWKIDRKIDDSYATTGNVIVGDWDVCTTASSMTDYADYDFSVKGTNCIIGFYDMF